MTDISLDRFQGDPLSWYRVIQSRPGLRGVHYDGLTGLRIDREADRDRWVVALMSDGTAIEIADLRGSGELLTGSDAETAIAEAVANMASIDPRSPVEA